MDKSTERYDFIEITKSSHLTIVTISRPEVMNALHIPACQEMDQAFNDFSEDPEAWVAILTGSGEQAFSAGNDLKWTAEHGPDAVARGLKTLKGGFGGIVRRFDLYKPVIAAVNGLALGGGFEMVLACDLVVAAEHAKFGLPETRVGFVANAGGIHRLPQKIPYNRAMELILTGRTITAEQTQSLGLINEVVPKGQALKTAQRWAMKILECAPLAVRASKEGAMQAYGRPLREIISKPFQGYMNNYRSEDMLEGARAFTEKRKPKWKGR